MGRYFGLPAAWWICEASLCLPSPERPLLAISALDHHCPQSQGMMPQIVVPALSVCGATSPWADGQPALGREISVPLQRTLSPWAVPPVDGFRLLHL